MSLEDDALEALRRKRSADAAAAEAAKKKAEIQNAMLREFIELAEKYGAPVKRFFKSEQTPEKAPPLDVSGPEGWVITRPPPADMTAKTVKYGMAVTTDGKIIQFKDGLFGPVVVETWLVLGNLEVSRDALITASMHIIDDADRRNQ